MTSELHVLVRTCSFLNLALFGARYGQPPVVVSAQQHDRHLAVVVDDRGRGVAPDFVPQLFERFARSGRARAERNGTGLGLAICPVVRARAPRRRALHRRRAEGAWFELVLPVG